MHLTIISVGGNPNIGLYGFATDKYCIVGHQFNEEHIAKIKEALQVPVHQMNLCGTPLVGVFAAGNGNHLLVPSIVLDDEKRQLKELGIPFTVVPTMQTALGNNIICNDKAVLVNPDMEPEARRIIGEALGLPVQVTALGELTAIGSLVALNDKGCLVSNEVNDEELAFLAESLGVPTGIGTVNFGSSFIASGILCNSFGLVMSRTSTGIEISNADEVLGFLNQ